MIPVEHIHRLKRPPIMKRRGVGDAACGPNAFQDPQSPWLTDGSGNPSSTPHCVLNTYSGKVYSQMGIPEEIAAQLPPGFNPNAPAMPGAVSVAQWFADPADTGGCPVIDPSKNTCASKNPNGTLSTVGCNAYRECDSLIPAMAAAGSNPFGTLSMPPHVEYGLPEPTGNVGFGAPASGNVPAQVLYPDVASAIYSIGSAGQAPARSGLPVSAAITGGSSGASGQPTTQQLAAGAGSNTVPSSAVNSGGSNALNYLGQSSIVSSIPNWVLLGGAALVLFFVMGGKK